MAESSFANDCHSLIMRGHESWKSYFSKWEAFAKHEESLPESELFSEPLDKIKCTKNRKVKRPLCKTKLKTCPLLSFKGKHRKGKKYIKKTKFFPRSKTEQKFEDCKISNPENLTDDKKNYQMEIILKEIFMDILKSNTNNLEIFAVLSQTNARRTDSCNLLTSLQTLSFNSIQLNEKTCLISNQLPSIMPEKNFNNKFLCPSREWYIHNNKKDLNLTDLDDKTVITNREFGAVENLNLNSTFPKFKCSYKNMNHEQFLFSVTKSQALHQKVQSKFGIKSCHLPPLNDSKFEIANLKPLDTGFSQKCPTSVFRKINSEYFTKKIFPEMNIAGDGKRFRKLCLHKRTNSVSLSMENSKFITPERKPSERKCFSENVLQRKRRCPSKLFFDNEVEDSESDDQTETKAPLIYCKNKRKSKILPQVVESDSDDCESIFDRVRKP